MKQSSKRLVSLALSLLFIVGALVILFDFVQPEYSTLQDVKAQISGEQEFLDTQTQAVAKAQTLLSTYAQQGQGGSNVSLAMPSSQDQAGAIAQIYGIAQNTGLTVGTVALSTPTIQTQPVAAGSPKQLVKPLGSISFQITASGSYESLKNFLSEIETNVRIFDLKSISVAQASAGIKGIFNYTIGVTSYYQTK